MAGESYGAYLNGSSVDKEITRVLFCVTYNASVEDYAVRNGYDLTISHHPSGGGTRLPHLTYHTALDCCKGGMNDMWADALGMGAHKPFDGNLGAVGEFIRPTTFGELIAKCKGFAGDIVGRIVGNDHMTAIGKTVICTGLGGMVAHEVTRLKPDCFITGQLYQNPETLGIPWVIELGHTRSERCGLDFFKGLLAPQGVEVDAVPMELDRFGNEVYDGFVHAVAASYGSASHT
jgi:putative NIF3 family GTP cyclohydrolase 1 type 2